MNHVWYKNYEPTVSKTIDTSKYSSINEVFEVAFTTFADKPALHNMGTTLTYAQFR